VVAEVVLISVAFLAVVAELIHARRVMRVSALAFGPRGGFKFLAVVGPILRVLAFAGVAWGLAALQWDVKPKSHRAGVIADGEYRHLILVLDVSPSMRLKDAGPGATQTRGQRAADLIQSFFERVQADRYKTTVIAVYTDAKPVVQDTYDREVVRNVLTELPMSHAFKSGETNIFAGLEEAAKIAKPWTPNTALLIVVTDGDTVPATGMPKMPPSIGTNIVVIGVGNPLVGKSIAGHSSRQDVSTLRSTATRLNGVYHDGNENHMSTDLVRSVDQRATPKREDKWTKREYALLAIGLGTGALALLPIVLTLLGTGWTPGRKLSAIRTGIRTKKRVESLSP